MYKVSWQDRDNREHIYAKVSEKAIGVTIVQALNDAEVESGILFVQKDK